MATQATKKSRLENKNMKKICSVAKWGVYELNSREREKYDFTYAVIHPEMMECQCGLRFEPRDTDWECYSLEDALWWIACYEREHEEAMDFAFEQFIKARKEELNDAWSWLILKNRGGGLR